MQDGGTVKITKLRFIFCSCVQIFNSAFNSRVIFICERFFLRGFFCFFVRYECTYFAATCYFILCKNGHFLILKEFDNLQQSQ